MKHFMRIFAVMISILIVMTSAISCKEKEVDLPDTTPWQEDDSTTTKKDTTKKPKPTITEDDGDEAGEDVPEIKEEEKGNIKIGTDSGAFSDATDMH